MCDKKQCYILKRCMMVIIILPLLPLLKYQELLWMRTLYYIVPTTSVSVYIILLNFPNVVRRMHSRPLYYGDLEDERFVSPNVRKRFQYVFIFISQVSLSLISSALVFYYYNRFHHTNLSNMEVLGVVGGFVSFLSKIENIVGKFTLGCMNMLKKRDSNKSISDVRRMRANSVELIVEV